MSTSGESSLLLSYTERGFGPPLLLVHGLLLRGQMYAKVIDHFAQRHRVIVPDLRGYGGSRGLGPPYTAKQLAADLPPLLDHLGIDTTAALGYSHGGAIAQQLVLDHPTRCKRLLLACTYAHNMATLREKIEGHIAPLVIGAFGLKRFAKFAISHGAKELGKDAAEWIDLISGEDTKLMVTAFKEAMAFDSRRRLTEIRCPTLIIAGSNDNAVPMHHTKMLHEVIAGSRVVVVDGANHALIWTNTAEFLRIADDFLTA